MPELRKGILRPLLRQLAPQQNLRAKRQRNVLGPSLSFRPQPRRFRRGNQAMSDVSRADRERRRMRANDVQAMQTRFLLVLPREPRRRFSLEALRFGRLQGPFGALQGFGALAQGASRRHFRRFRHSASGRFAFVASGGSLHYLLQVQRTRQVTF